MSDATVLTIDTQENDRKRRQDLYDKHSTQAWVDQQASSDSFDNNLLTFSSGALGLSLAFIKDIVPLSQAYWIGWLFFSWGAFSVCILSTIASFQFGIQAQKKHLDYLQRYYICGEEHFLDKKSYWSSAVTWCAVAGSLFFAAGLVSTLIFACKNITHVREVHVVSAKSDNNDSKLVGTLDARSPVPMTQVPKAQSPTPATTASSQSSPQEERGRAPANMTPIDSQQQAPVQSPSTPSPQKKD